MVSFIPSFLCLGCVKLVSSKEWLVSSFHVYVRAVLWYLKERGGQFYDFMSISGLCYGWLKNKMVSCIISWLFLPFIVVGKRGKVRFIISCLCRGSVMVSQTKGSLMSSFHVYVGAVLSQFEVRDGQFHHFMPMSGSVLL